MDEPADAGALPLGRVHVQQGAEGPGGHRGGLRGDDGLQGAGEGGGGCVKGGWMSVGRDLVAIGAACGVTTAFKAPLT